MIQHHAGRWRLGALALGLALALLGISPVRADEPEERGPPLFDANLLRDALHRGALVSSMVCVPAHAPTGPWSSLAVLHAGAHDRLSLWSLEGPLSNIYSRRALGATTLVLSAPPGLSGGPLSLASGYLATLHAGAYAGCWQWHDPTYLRPFHRDELRVITDGKDVPIGTDETAVYGRAFIRAHRASVAAFAKAARREVTHAHVMRDPDLYRGAVMHIEGRLKRINRYEPPLREVGLAGVNDAYEAWVFPEHLGGRPFCVRFTEWPRGLSRELLGKPAIDAPVRVSFDGFFFKTFRYPSNDGRNTLRDAPLLIGHSLVVLPEPAADPAKVRFTRWLGLGIAASLAALVLGAVGITYWYRRSDNRVRRRLLAAQGAEWVPPPPDATPVAAPVAAPVRKTSNGTDARPFPPRITTLPSRGDRGDGGEPGGTEKPPDDASGA